MKQLNLRLSKWAPFPEIHFGDIFEVVEVDRENCKLAVNLVHRPESQPASVSDLGIAVSDGINTADRMG